MDANTGVVLYGKNIHETYSPASITKVLTSLIVLEHCSLDETVTFSESAVYNVESNSSSAGYDTGDTASVKDCLYALLLKSANEAANALAEHVAGSADAFAVLMNEKAAELGCQDSHFANPSGLNNEEHYVSAYDMALITRAAFENPTFAKIVETTYYKLPPNQKNPEGQGISPGNKLVKKNWPQYYRPDVLGGKTGYTSIALNTLVNGARQGDTTLITVILHSNNTQYEDTSRLLDFGFNNFQSVKIADYDQTFSNIGKDLKISDVSTAGGESLSIDPDSRVVLPKTADFSETTTSFDYEIPAGAPDGTIACVTYSLGDHKVGQAYLTLTDSSQTAADIPEKLVSQAATAAAQDSSDTALSNGSSEALPLSNPPESAANQENSSTGKSFGQLFHISVRVPPAFIAALTAILVVIGAVTAGIRFLQMQRRQEEDALAERRRRRAERLRDSGMSEADFDLMMQDRRTALAKKRKKRSHKNPITDTKRVTRCGNSLLLPYSKQAGETFPYPVTLFYEFFLFSNSYFIRSIRSAAFTLLGCFCRLSRLLRLVAFRALLLRFLLLLLHVGRSLFTDQLRRLNSKERAVLRLLHPDLSLHITVLRADRQTEVKFLV